MDQTYNQDAGTLGLRFRKADNLSAQIDFDPISLTGFTVSATISSLVSGATVTSIVTTLADAALGKVNISLPQEQTATLPVGTYRWDMTATDGGRRTYLTGFVEVTR